MPTGIPRRVVGVMDIRVPITWSADPATRAGQERRVVSATATWQAVMPEQATVLPLALVRRIKRIGLALERHWPREPRPEPVSLFITKARRLYRKA